MENIRDIILGARAERQEHMLKGFAPVADETESDKVEKGDNVFEKMADAIEKSCSDDAEEALQAENRKVGHHERHQRLRFQHQVR